MGKKKRRGKGKGNATISRGDRAREGYEIGRIRTINDVRSLEEGVVLAHIILNQLPSGCPLSPRPSSGGVYRFKGGRGALAVEVAQNIRLVNQGGENPPTCRCCANRECRAVRRADYFPPSLPEADGY